VLDLKAYRRGAASLADLLPYIFLVDDGVVALKDGALMAAWEFRGKDTASSAPEELAHVSDQVNQALMSLDSGWMM
jgi:type IV secretion system protein VirB4